MLDLECLTLAGVAHRCAQESERFFRRLSNDPRYCFELFRRAILERSQEAWELVYAQYHALVLKWATLHPALSATVEEPQYFVNRAFEKMWSSITADKFSHFPDLKSVLRYLQMCVHSVIVDSARRAEQSRVEASTEEEYESREHGPSVEAQVVERMQRQALWECLNSRLHNEKERCVTYGSFILNLKPQELHAAYRETFQDIEEVYRIKQNVLDRLRRDQKLFELIGPGS